MSFAAPGLPERRRPAAEIEEQKARARFSRCGTTLLFVAFDSLCQRCVAESAAFAAAICFMFTVRSFAIQRAKRAQLRRLLAAFWGEICDG
jgi:hypothetical protein